MFSDQFYHFLLTICISCFEFDCVSCHDCPAKVLFEGDITPRTGSLWLLPPSLEKTKQSTPSPVILLIGQQRIINVETFWQPHREGRFKMFKNDFILPRVNGG